MLAVTLSSKVIFPHQNSFLMFLLVSHRLIVIMGSLSEMMMEENNEVKGWEKKKMKENKISFEIKNILLFAPIYPFYQGK